MMYEATNEPLKMFVFIARDYSELVQEVSNWVTQTEGPENPLFMIHHIGFGHDVEQDGTIYYYANVFANID